MLPTLSCKLFLRVIAVPELCHPDLLSDTRSLTVNYELDSITCRLFAGVQEPRAVDRLLQLKQSWNTLTCPPNPSAEKQAFWRRVAVFLAKHCQPSCSSPGIAGYRTLRQLSWRPLAAKAFTPTCSNSDTSLSQNDAQKNLEDSFRRPCGSWS